MDLRRKLQADLGIALGYAIGAGLWIAFSDSVLAALFPEDPQNLALFQFFKGSAFVAVTALLLYILLHRIISRHRYEETLLNRENQHREEQIDLLKREINSLREQMKTLDTMKSKFVADASHELRSPVTILNTSIYLLEHSQPDNQARHVQKLKEQVAALTLLVENLLDISRIDAGTTALEFKPVDVPRLVDQTVQAYLPLAEEKGLTLNADLPGDLPPVIGDYNQLAQAVGNLVQNALNYTLEGGVSIQVRYEQAAGRVQLSVRDTGIGVSEEALPHLFERFYRGLRAKQAGVRGTGLGLSIVKEIVTLHKGDIEVTSVAEQGSTFTISLPAQDGRAAGETAPVSSQAVPQ